MALYFLQIDPPLGTDKHRARYYAGYSKDGEVWRRFDEHCAGKAAAITRYAVEHGHELRLIYQTTGGRGEERRAKKYGIERYLRRLEKLHGYPILPCQQ